MWIMKPKFHLWAELSFFQTFETGDPRDFWLYQDEDFVGLVAQLAMQRGGSRKIDTIPRNVINRYKMLAQR